jgi:hypothetical protein
LKEHNKFPQEEMWLSPVIQATGRQEQWDNLRWKISTSAADGIWWPHQRVYKYIEGNPNVVVVGT